MVNEFVSVTKILIKLNQKTNILNKEDISDLQLYLTYFIEDQKSLINNINKLSNLDKVSVDKIITDKVDAEIGPISSIFTNIHLALVEYESRFYIIKQFLRKILYYYKKKAKLLYCSQKNLICSELATSRSKQYVSGIPEIERLMELIEMHNNYLGENRILDDKLIIQGYKHAAELSVLSCEIQTILHNLDSTAYNNFCRLDLLLRLLTEKIGASMKHIDWIQDKITRGMVGVYPDCYRTF